MAKQTGSNTAENDNFPVPSILARKFKMAFAGTGPANDFSYGAEMQSITHKTGLQASIAEFFMARALQRPGVHERFQLSPPVSPEQNYAHLATQFQSQGAASILPAREILEAHADKFIAQLQPIDPKRIVAEIVSRLEAKSAVAKLTTLAP